MKMSARNALTSVGIVGVLALGCSKVTGSSGSSDGTTTNLQGSAALTTGTTTASASAPTTTATTVTTAKATATGSGSSSSPKDVRTAKYPLADVKPMADDCATPTVILANAPASVGDSYGWQISRQAFLANQQFTIVSGKPVAPGEVHLSTYHYSPFGTTVYALVATCDDGGTCNQVAAMYKAVVRSSKPQLTCGTPPGLTGDPIAVSWNADPKDNLPPAGNAEAACARLNACMLTYGDTPGDPLLDCQKDPANFKIACASRYPCSDVLACSGPAPASAAKTPSEVPARTPASTGAAAAKCPPGWILNDTCANYGQPRDPSQCCFLPCKADADCPSGKKCQPDPPWQSFCGP